MKNRKLAIAAMLCWTCPLAVLAADAPVAAKAAAEPAITTPAATGAKESNGEGRPSPMWHAVFVEPGRRVEIDQASVRKMNDGKVQAYGRILFERALPDAVSGGTYQILEALNAYDCDKRTFATHRRLYRKDEKSLLRDEASLKKTELPVRSGTLDEKLLRAACLPGATELKTSFSTAVAKAKAAAEPGAEPRKELLRTEFGGGPKTVAQAAPAASSPSRPAARPVRKTPGKEAAVSAPAPEHLEWSYEGRGGPQNWGQLSPENKLCDSGKRQSPIDLRDGIRVDLPTIGFSYRPSLFRLIDTGQTVQAAVSDNRISLLGKTYELIQFHFHRPAEERINGRSYEMSVHLVHRAYDGQLAILAVPIERGSEHPLIQTLWNHLPLEPHLDVHPPGVAIDLNQLLPEQRGYYTYMGSLTTPPCSEGVLWLVMQSPIQVSAEQIGIFSRLHPNNVRPIQPQNGRLIKESR